MEQLNPETRILPDDNLIKILTKMAEGNPGALSCLVEMAKNEWPGNVPGVFKIMQLDSMGVYGTNIYMLWNDCCDRDLDKMDKVITRWSTGELSRDKIFEHLSDGRGIPFKAV